MNESVVQAQILLELCPMAFRSKRLETFDGHWDLFPMMSPIDLAKYGFYYFGNAFHPDLVRCCYCGGKIYAWDAHDTALGEHKRLLPNCPVFGRPRG